MLKHSILLIGVVVFLSACSSVGTCDGKSGVYPRNEETEALELPPDLISAQKKDEKATNAAQ
jgi:uncharacterized lipoprotein